MPKKALHHNIIIPFLIFNNNNSSFCGFPQCNLGYFFIHLHSSAQGTFKRILMQYNTDINIIGSIPDYHLIYRSLPLLINNPAELENILVTNNEFDFRTEKSRKRFLSLLNSAFVSKSEAIDELASSLMLSFKNDENAQALLLFWLFSINNKLFFELNRDIFLKYYLQGRAELPKEAVVAYIKDLISTNEDLKGKWSEITIETIASKYLTVLKKLKLVEGTKKKKFTLVRVSDELLAVFVHIISLLDNKKANFLEDDFLSFTFISKENILARLKQIGKKEWIKLNFNGVSLQVEPVFNNNNIIDGIFRRA
ncbi:DUF1819 family protein [Flavobacterium caseinilyticum]|jgi:hypothetical protein|uniref:DUF1819 family protein n=2 Tax=Flavobacterium caseinilyticum TaxID=2541732 RepID=A0A4R5B5T2_9FLAO|nr:DUF1819 family protein [Flavobacterium caseinilyticum]